MQQTVWYAARKFDPSVADSRTTGWLCVPEWGEVWSNIADALVLVLGRAQQVEPGASSQSVSVEPWWGQQPASVYDRARRWIGPADVSSINMHSECPSRSRRNQAGVTRYSFGPQPHVSVAQRAKQQALPASRS